MGSGNTTVPSERVPRLRGRSGAIPLVPMLMKAWSRYEPWTIGHIARLDGERIRILGRGMYAQKGRQVVFDEQTPGQSLLIGSLTEGTLAVSREHIRFVVEGLNAVVENITTDPKSPPMLVNGIETRHAQLAPGDVIEILDHYVFLFLLRPAEIAACKFWPHEPHAFGEADAYAMVGGSPAAWAFRELLARVALSREHVLLLGLLTLS